MITLFRCTTGEDWHRIMFDLSITTNCTEGVNIFIIIKAFSTLFFLTYIMLTTIIMLNLFILIILNDFEEFNLKEDNSIDQFKVNLDKFILSWN